MDFAYTAGILSVTFCVCPKWELRSCYVGRLNTALFACGSMVRVHPFVCGFLRSARKTAHDEKSKYRSAEGSARQLPKFY
jgi:hypothetical protein